MNATMVFSIYILLLDFDNIASGLIYLQLSFLARSRRIYKNQCCYCVLLLCAVTVCCYCGLLLCAVTVGCYCGLLLWAATVCCYCVLFSTSTLLLCAVLMYAVLHSNSARSLLWPRHVTDSRNKITLLRGNLAYKRNYVRHLHPSWY